MDDLLFSDKALIPNNKELEKVLGNSYRYWEEIKKLLNEKYGIIIEEWKHYGKKTGWILKNFCKKRNLFFLKPYKKYFLISFVFGAKGLEEIENSSLPERIIKNIEQAIKYAEGRGLSVEVKNKSDVDIIMKLVEIKINN